MSQPALRYLPCLSNVVITTSCSFGDVCYSSVLVAIGLDERLMLVG